MAEDWAADVKKFVADADDKVIAAIVRYCGIALQNRDSSLVSFTDPVETGRVRDNFLKKKLGLTEPDEVLDQAIATVGERMKGTSFRNRVTVYYLLLEHFGLLHLFGGAAPAAGTASAGALGGAAAAGLAGLAGTAGATPAPEPAAAPLASAPPPPGAGPAYVADPVEDDGKGGFGWWPWLLLALLALALLWWLFFRQPGDRTASPVAPMNEAANAMADAGNAIANVASNIVDLAAAPAEGTVTIPTGAGVTVETRDSKPVVKVYFDTGKADVVSAFAPTADGLKAYLASHAGASLAVSGFNDPTGDAAANAELAKNRAEAVKAALVAAGIADSAIELVKPAEATDATTSHENARRVEVVVR